MKTRRKFLIKGALMMPLLVVFVFGSFFSLPSSSTAASMGNLAG
jgi:hypothetical protein